MLVIVNTTYLETNKLQIAKEKEKRKVYINKESITIGGDLVLETEHKLYMNTIHIFEYIFHIYMLCMYLHLKRQS